MNRKLFKKATSFVTATLMSLMTITAAIPVITAEAVPASQSLDEKVLTEILTENKAAFQCSPSSVNLKAGTRATVNLSYNGSESIFIGNLDFSVEDESVAKVIQADYVSGFYVQGLKEGSTVITVTNQYEGITFKATLPVTVEANDTIVPGDDLSQTGIHVEINSLPYKRAYSIGEELDLDGGTYSVYFNGGGDCLQTIYSEQSMTDDVYIDIDTSAFDNTKLGIYPITITYNHYTGYYGSVTFNVEVVDDALARFDVNTDGMVSIDDAVLVLSAYVQNAAGMGDADIQNILKVGGIYDVSMDINNDGIINISDALCILEYYAYNAAGLEYTF